MVRQFLQFLPYTTFPVTPIPIPFLPPFLARSFSAASLVRGLGTMEKQASIAAALRPSACRHVRDGQIVRFSPFLVERGGRKATQVYFFGRHSFL